MPFIKAKVSCPITHEHEKELKSLLGKAIELVPGKTEAYLLLEFEGNCHLWLRGKNFEPAAYIEAAIFGNEGHEGYPAFSVAVTKIFRDVLGIPPANCYVKYEDIVSWSVAGQYIDRRIYG